MRPNAESPGPLQAAPTVVHAWAWLLVEELTRLGLRHVCLAPGSRSTPLVVAAADHPRLTRHVHYDERGLGFMALGLARATGEPVAIVTTSGTAVANLLPAMVEARLTHLPLLALTADRPPELIDVGANQAIHQSELLDGGTGWATTLPRPTSELTPRFVLGVAARLWLVGLSPA